MKVLYHLTAEFTASSHPFTFDEYTRARATLDVGEIACAGPATFPPETIIRLELEPGFRHAFKVTSAEIQIANGETTLVAYATHRNNVSIEARRGEQLRTLISRARKAISKEMARFHRYGFGS